MMGCSESGDTSNDEKISCLTPSLVCKFQCSVKGCSALFNRQWKLDSHVYGHNNQRPFTCSYAGCIKGYRSPHHLKRHIKVSHTQPKEMSTTFYNCPEAGCQKHFSNKHSVEKHLKGHSAPPKYKCEECNLVFRKHHQLSSHNFIHTRLFPFMCPDCPEGFLTKAKLQKHEKKHQEYICEYTECGQSFDNWSSLRKHLKNCHPTVYSCASCNKNFRNKTLLEDHVLTHLPNDVRDVLPCPYDKCLKIYYYKKNLQQHIQCYHEMKRHACPVDGCSAALVTKAKLKLHLQRKHELSQKPTIEKTKKKRKPRKDKGMPKQSACALLSGIPLPNHVNKMLLQGETSHAVQEELDSIIDRYALEDVDSGPSDDMKKPVLVETL